MNITKKSELKNFGIGIGVFLLYIIISSVTSVVYNQFIAPATDSNFILFGYDIVTKILILSLLILIYNKTIVKNFIEFKNNHQILLKKYIKYWFILLGLTMFSNLIIQFLQPDSIANNEELIRDMLKISPIYIFMSAVIFAPILEELIFRQAFRFIFKTDIIFIIFSGLIFGLFHVTQAETFIDFLYIIPYSIPGIIFAYTLVKSNNIFVPISLHFIHNGILTSLQILLSFLM